MERPALILDADDTLWETNRFYEEAVEAFVERMVQEGFEPDRVRRVFDRVEQERVPLAGYAPAEFAHSMAIAYRRLCEQEGRPPSPDVEAEAEEIGRRVIGHPILLLDGVAETLPRLHPHYRLLLLTKGDPQIQRDKVRRSGLEQYLEAIYVVPEKGPEVLQELLERHRLDPQRTWMVGDSPRSDINPALDAGIGAIHIPYARPWTLEQTTIRAPERVVTLRRFSDLARLFLEEAEP